MSTDPYHAVKAEVDLTLRNAEILRASYLRISSTAPEGSEELQWARNELKATLAALAADLEDLEESVRIVESTGSRMFGLEESEVIERRKHLGKVRRTIEVMRAELSGSVIKPSEISIQNGSNKTAQTENGEDDWSREEQQMLMQQQDQTLTSISGTLNTLAEQAGLMGQEIMEHNEMLDDLEANVDKTDDKLGSAMKKMQKFIRDTEETKSGWCIGILIVILSILQ
ncbi:hypothetical protein Clacol_009305 [Clathrus columnatus]|uniref:t-SNARE coiled-coil homology domain-containing protein n=1 Tax=Clathrus columnatus TaxID=1419009 RepID=A0AAV5AK39_9AGAM|nr:hypothetical protein Clacol_009305 [Clathrus columnatus]